MKREPLDSSTISQRLDELDAHWRIERTCLVSERRFGSYMQGIEFVNRVAALAESMNHHPDIEIGWRKVTLRLTTHSAGGLTELDLTLATQIDGLR